MVEIVTCSPKNIYISGGFMDSQQHWLKCMDFFPLNGGNFSHWVSNLGRFVGVFCHQMLTILDRGH